MNDDPIKWIVKSGPYYEEFYVYATAQAQVFELLRAGYSSDLIPVYENDDRYTITEAGRAMLRDAQQGEG